MLANGDALVDGGHGTLTAGREIGRLPKPSRELVGALNDLRRLSIRPPQHLMQTVEITPATNLDQAAPQ
jgi:hypothetical protein